MTNRRYGMSKAELERVKIIEQIKSKRISQIMGAEELGISTRHLRRVIGEYEQRGEEGLICKRYGKPKPSNS